MLLEPIKIYIISPSNNEKDLHTVTKEFACHEEFDIEFFDLDRYSITENAFWNSAQIILQNISEPISNFIIICSTSHRFPTTFSKERFYQSIQESNQRNADLLLGGIAWFDNILQVSDNLFWVDRFEGCQFAVIFNRFFNILRSGTWEKTQLRNTMQSQKPITFLTDPFITNIEDKPTGSRKSYNNFNRGSFQQSTEAVKKIKTITNCLKVSSIKAPFNFKDIFIPTYVINRACRTDRRKHIEEEFLGKSEFKLTFVEACEHLIGAVGLWQSIRKVISIALDNKDDVIVICEDDHQFTQAYSKEAFLQNVYDASLQSADLLVGGIGKYSLAVPAANNRVWISSFWCTQFIVVYRKFFHKILDAAFNNDVTADELLSKLNGTKMVVFPFISIQRDFGYSDVTTMNNSPFYLQHLFVNAQKGLQRLMSAYFRYCAYS